MIEMRYVKKMYQGASEIFLVDVLQYRYQGLLEWSEWKDVPKTDLIVD